MEEIFMLLRNLQAAGREAHAQVSKLNNTMQLNWRQKRSLQKAFAYWKFIRLDMLFISSSFT